MIRRTWRQLATFMPHPNRTALSLAVTALIAGISEAIVLVIVVRTALDLAQSGDNSSNLVVAGREVSIQFLLAVGGVFAVVALICHAFIAHAAATASAQVLHSARTRLTSAYLNASWSRQVADREGALQEGVSNLAMQSSLLTVNLISGLASAVSLAVLLIAAFVVSPATMVVVLVAGLLLFAIMRPVARLTRARAKKFVGANSAYGEEVSAMTSLAMELRVFGTSTMEQQRIEARSDSAAVDLRRTRFASRFGSTLYRDVAMLAMLVAVAILAAVGGDVLAGAAPVIVLIIRALSSSQAVQGAVQAASEQGANVDLLISRIEELERSQDQFGELTLDEIGSLEVKGVSYVYPDGTRALDDVKLSIGAGEMLGVVGPSGGGKTTLVQVLLRLRMPDSGEVLVNGLPYQDYSAESWASAVSLVSQEPRLKEGSVSENIEFGRSTIDSGAVVAAATAAHVADDIGRLRDGYATRLGPRGAGLSGGQKQRVAIARALAGQPQFLVLDEPTSALDVASEHLIKETVVALKGTITTVIVAHRLSTLESCDRLLLVRAGRVEVIDAPKEALKDDAFRMHITSLLHS